MADTKRAVKRAALRAQLLEAAVGDGLRPLELESGDIIHVKVPVSGIGDDTDTYLEAIKAAGQLGEREMAIEALSHFPGMSGEEQLALFEADGGELWELFQFIRLEREAAEEKVRNFRYRG